MLGREAQSLGDTVTENNAFYGGFNQLIRNEKKNKSIKYHSLLAH